MSCKKPSQPLPNLMNGPAGQNSSSWSKYLRAVLLVEPISDPSCLVCSVHSSLAMLSLKSRAQRPRAAILFTLLMLRISQTLTWRQLSDFGKSSPRVSLDTRCRRKSGDNPRETLKFSAVRLAGLRRMVKWNAKSAGLELRSSHMMSRKRPRATCP